MAWLVRFNNRFLYAPSGRRTVAPLRCAPAAEAKRYRASVQEWELKSMAPSLRSRKLCSEVAPDFVLGAVPCFRGNVFARVQRAPGGSAEAVQPWFVGEASDAKPLVLASRTLGSRSAQRRSIASASRGSLRPRQAGQWFGALFARVATFRGFPYNNAFVPTVSARSHSSVSCGPAAQGRRYAAAKVTRQLKR